MIQFTSKWLVFIGVLLLILQVTSAAQTCNSTLQCPEDSPCCSQYGECGTGIYCLGGCDPRYSYNLTACMPMPRMGDLETTFDDKKLVKNQEDYLGNYTESDWLYTGHTDIHDDALLLQMPKDSSGTVISSTKYLWYGRVNATLKTSHGGGVVTAFILFSDVQDEIDFEFVGYNLTGPQSNYYALGITDYDNANSSTTSNTFENYHDYSIDWKEDHIDWYIDGQKVRTLEKSDTWNKTAKRFDFPQTPSRVQFSLWPGGAPSNGKGTIEWAGGEINWNSQDIKKYGYFYAYLKNITVEAYDQYLDDVKETSNKNISDMHAYLFNNSRGWDDNVMLTNEKTWLGSEDATGLDPDNDTDDDEHHSHTTKHKTTTGSSSTKAGKTGTTTKNNPGQATGKATGKANGKGTTTASPTYNPSQGVGGFVQNYQSSKDGSSETSSSSKSTSKSNGSSIRKGNALIFTIFVLSISLFMVL